MLLCEYCKINKVRTFKNRFCSNSCSAKWRVANNLGHILRGCSKGHIPWNLNLTKETDMRVAKISGALRGRIRQDLSIIAKVRWQNSEFKNKMSKILKESEANRSIEDKIKANAKISDTLKKKWRDPVFALDQISRHSFVPNKKEIFLDNFLQKNFSRMYRYVGNGSFWIGNPPMNPDYLGKKGNNKTIELFGEHWHKPEEEQKRIEAFKKLEYDCLVIWTVELKDEKRLFDKINEFNFRNVISKEIAGDVREAERLARKITGIKKPKKEGIEE